MGSQGTEKNAPMEVAAQGVSSTSCGRDGCAITGAWGCWERGLRVQGRALQLPGSQDLVCPCSAPDTSGYCQLLIQKVWGVAGGDIQLCFSL